MTTKLSATQQIAMQAYSLRTGETFDVLTGEPTKNVDREFVQRAYGPKISQAALRGLEARGLIKINQAFWKGATITVIKA